MYLKHTMLDISLACKIWCKKRVEKRQKPDEILV